MEADVVRIWATPSALHLRVVFWGAKKKWMRSTECHIRWAEIPSEQREQIASALQVRSEDREQEQLDTPLF